MREGGRGVRKAALLLAAGASSRMGAPKALLRYPPGPEGEPLVRRVARALIGGGASSVLVVGGPDETGQEIASAVADLEAVSTVINPEPGRGMLSSVQTGVRQAMALPRRGPCAPPTTPAAFLVCPCDLPQLTAAHVAPLLEAWDGEETAIVVPTFGGKRGHPTLFGGKWASEVLTLDPRKYGLNALLKRHAGRLREVPLPDDAILRDADTPSEWQALVGAFVDAANQGDERDGR